METRTSKTFSRKTLLISLTSILLLIAASSGGEGPSGTNEGDKQQVVQQVAQRWIQVGTEQYRKGFFKAAEQSFLRAQDYQEYLSVAEREKINELLTKAARTVDPEQRNVLYKQAQEIIVDEALGIWAFQIGDAVAMKDYVKGFVFTPANFGVYDFYLMSIEK